MARSGGPMARQEEQWPRWRAATRVESFSVRKVRGEREPLVVCLYVNVVPTRLIITTCLSVGVRARVSK